MSMNTGTLKLFASEVLERSKLPGGAETLLRNMLEDKPLYRILGTETGRARVLVFVVHNLLTTIR